MRERGDGGGTRGSSAVLRRDRPEGPEPPRRRRIRRLRGCPEARAGAAGVRAPPTKRPAQARYPRAVGAIRADCAGREAVASERFKGVWGDVPPWPPVKRRGGRSPGISPLLRVPGLRAGGPAHLRRYPAAWAAGVEGRRSLRRPNRRPGRGGDPRGALCGERILGWNDGSGRREAAPLSTWGRPGQAAQCPPLSCGVRRRRGWSSCAAGLRAKPD